MKKIFKFTPILSLIALSPVIVFAATGPCDALTGIGKSICQIQQLLNSIIPVLIALGVIYFIWGIVQYVIGDSEEAKKKGRDGMIYGIIGFAVIIGMWGLVNIVGTTFGINSQDSSNLAPKNDTLKNLLPQ
jgi:hypothetical protein